jgi:hypothetical protein
MPDSAITPNVFLDTEVFDGQGLDFASPNFMRLIRLATAGTVKLFLTTVTREEIKRHLDEHATKAFKQMSDYRRASRIVKKMLPPDMLATLGTADEGAIRNDLHRDFTVFTDNTKAEILSIDEVSPDAVFKRYFEQKPPFGDRHKKNEFPDAFACAALQAWCARTKSKIYVVSGDPDWKWVCASDPSLIHLNSLDQLLEQFADSVVVTAIKEVLAARKEEVEKLINSEAENLDYYVSDNLIDGEYDDLEVNTEVEEFHVVEVADGQAVVTAFCTITIQASITADDPNSMWTDPDTRDVKSVWELRGSVEQENECDVTVSVTYDQKRPEDVKIGKVEFQDKSVEIEVEEGQLGCSAEDEWDDMDDIIPPDDF